MNVHRVIVNSFSKCPLTPAVSKASAGALELIDVYAVRNPEELLNVMQAEQGWTVVTTGNESSMVELDKLSFSDSEDSEDGQPVINVRRRAAGEGGRSKPSSPSKNVVLLIGSESEGVSSELNKFARYSVWINRNKFREKQEVVKFPGTLVDSLNVNAATAIIIHKIQQTICKMK